MNDFKLEPRERPKKLSEMTLKVNEIFGPTIQGEGPSVGRPAMFLRLFGCPLHCKFCDTAYTWRVNDSFEHYGDEIYDPKKECHTMTFGEIYEELISKIGPYDNMPSLLVITGGEPMVQNDLRFFIEYINHPGAPHTKFDRIEIETSGFRSSTFIDYINNVHFNVSPKLESSGNPFDLRHNYVALQRFVDIGAYFKFVYTNQEDLDEIEGLIGAYGIPRNRVYLMPECIDQAGHEQRLPEVIDAAIKMDVNVAPRLHIIAWGNKRGV